MNNFRRRLVRFLPIALSMWATAGCVQISSYYSTEDTTKPQAFMEDEYVDEKGQYFFLRQSEKEATGSFSEWGEFTGAVKGRVFIGEADYRDVAFTLREDGLGGRLGYVFMMQDGQERRAYKLHLGRSADDPGLKTDLASGGGLVCQLPGPGGDARRTLVMLMHSYDSRGQVVALRRIVPLESGARGWNVGFPGEGIFTRTLDHQSLLHARKGVPLYRKQEAMVDGKPCWWVMSPQWSNDSTSPSPDFIVGEFYREDPDTGAAPVEISGLLQRSPGGEWRPMEGKGYVLSCSRITRARAILENGVPVRVEAVEQQSPALEEFLVLQEPFVRLARWRNHALLDVKNKTLPKVLVEYKTSDLSALSIRLEKLILDLNHEAESLRDRAQKAVEKGTLAAVDLRENKREISQIRGQLQDPDLPPNEHYRLNNRVNELEREVARATREQAASEHAVDDMREMSTVYKERVEVLKPFLPAIKDELANRAK